MKVFWSWQSDTPGKTGRFFIRGALSAAIEQLKRAPDIEEPTTRANREALHLDQDRQGIPGSPDLARAILDKIDVSNVVIADVTPVAKMADRTDGSGNTLPGKKLINSNVAIELGYALRALTDRKVLLVFNAHYGKHEELPFDLRHKGGAIVFDLPPEADALRITQERKKLTAHFVTALEPYLRQSSAPAFAEVPATFSKAAYFSRGDVLAQAGVAGVDQIDFSYTAESLCYLRMLPTQKLDRSIPLAALADAVRQIPLLKRQPAGVLTDRNTHGAIGFEPGSNPPGGGARLSSSTQLFQNGELWSISAELIARERGHRPAHIKLPLLPALLFEQSYYNALRSLLSFASERLDLQPPWQVECGLAGVNGLYLGVPLEECWGPV